MPSFFSIPSRPKGPSLPGPHAMGAGRTQFLALDALRGVAALMVVERHKPDFLFGQALPAGYLAVDLFFLLSGFVLAHAYEERLRQGMPIGRFMLGRLIRLYPLYLAGTLLGIALFALFIWQAPPGADDPRSFRNLALSSATALAFLPTPEAWSVKPDRLFPLNEPAWSLFFELLANLIFAVLILSLSVRRMLALAVLAGALFAASVIWFGTADLAFDWRTFLSGFPRVIFGFFAGILLYRAHLALPPMPAAAGLTWPLCLFLVVLIAMPVGAALRPFHDIFVCLIVLPALVLAAARAEPSQRSAVACTALGAASYGIYVFHMPLARLFKAVAERIGIDVAASTPWIGFVYVAALAAGAWLAHYIYDVPIRRWLTKRLLPRTEFALDSAPAKAPPGATRSLGG